MEVVRVQSQASMGSSAAQPKRGEVYRLEVHFMYPFEVTEEGLENVGLQATQARTAARPSRLDGPDNFGNDGHLLFDQVIKTITVGKRSVTSPKPGLGRKFTILNADESDSPVLLKLQDSKGNEYALIEAHVRLLSFRIGIVRFALLAQQPVTVQDVLNVQNGVMRLTSVKQAK